MNNGNGEAEKKLQQIYSLSQRAISIDSAIKNCVQNQQCANNEKELEHWSKLLSFIAKFRLQQPRLNFNHIYFEQNPEASYFIDQTVATPLAFNVKVLYLTKHEALSTNEMLELLCFALQDLANLESPGLQKYFCSKLAIFSPNNIVSK